MKKADIGVKGFMQFKPRAAMYVRDKKMASQLIHKAIRKASAVKSQGPIEASLEKLSLLVSIFKDYVSGRYKNISLQSIIIVTTALVYFVCPADLIPDVPFLGYIDDASVIGFVISQLNTELEKYKCWREEQQAVASGEQ